MSRQFAIGIPFVCSCIWLLSAAAIPPAYADPIPAEPVSIGTVPQFFIDDYIVDNRYALKYKKEAVVRVFHQPKKSARNPLGIPESGYPSVLRDEDAGLFRMWYQTHIIGDPKSGRKTQYAIAYAESKDGLSWTLPELGLFEWKGSKNNNICWKGITDKRASGPNIIDVPEKDRRGYRFVLGYRTGGAREHSGIRVVGSHDGIHWDKQNDTLLAPIHSDTLNSIVYDPQRGQYVMYCRAKHIYRTFKGSILDTGASRRVARMANDRLWARWNREPQNILIPDETDSSANFNFFYGMPTHYHAGIYWGFLWCFKMNNDIYTALATSRDGFRFDRLASRPRLIELGAAGSWDDGMNFAGTRWVEVDDQWWIYYAGWDGPHKIPAGQPQRKADIGLATIRKEGFISMRGPRNGGVIITRKLRWPGGDLIVNADASEGELKVRVSGEKRKPIDGFDYQDCQAFTGDGIAHPVAWKEKSLDALIGQEIRLEFFLRDADIYTFRATGKEE